MTAAPYTDPAKLAQVLDLARRCAPHQVPLLEAVQVGLISMAAPSREHPFPRKILDSFKRPALLLVSDDDGLDTGPAGWACRPRLAGWARRAVIHASGGERQHYILAVMVAREVGRLVFVETGTAHFQRWHDLFARAGVRTLNLIPKDGEAHPIPLRREDLH